MTLDFWVIAAPSTRVGRPDVVEFSNVMATLICRMSFPSAQASATLT